MPLNNAMVCFFFIEVMQMFAIFYYKTPLKLSVSPVREAQLQVVCLVEGEEGEVSDQVMIIITRTWRVAKSSHNLEKQAKSKVWTNSSKDK